MTITRKILATAFAFGCCAMAWGQASVDESKETASLYVDANHGSDSNPGSQQRPLKTIGAAAAKAITNNQAGIGTKVIINSGTYRETVALTGNVKDTLLPITFQAATAGTAILSGADVWGGWKVYSGNSNIYTHAWPNRWGLCPLDTGSGTPPPEEDVVRRRETVFVNSLALTQ